MSGKLQPHTILYQGYPVGLVEENGRRFWVARVPDPSGWSLRQEFCSREDAMRYVREKVASNEAYFARQKE